MEKEKNSIGRKIFQPTKITELLVDNHVKKFDEGVSEFINACIMDYYNPRHPFILDEFSNILNLMKQDFDFDDIFCKEVLSRVIQKLVKCPIQDCNVLKAVLWHFTCKIGRWNCYDYYNRILDEKTDKLLRHYRLVLQAIDSTYNPGRRELGDTSRAIFENWDKLCDYAETYSVLSIIVSAEDVYIPIDVYDVLLYLKKIDNAVSTSGIKRLRDFPDENSICIDQQIHALTYEVSIYYDMDAYSEVTGDRNCEKVPSEIHALWNAMIDGTLSADKFSTKEEQLNFLTDFREKCKCTFNKAKIRNMINVID
ncbi:hypothetical protein AALA24_12670 [Anaerovoracaceae bacterium 42-11]